MKVLHVIDKLDVGGAEKVFVDITYLLANNSDVLVGALLFDGTGELTKHIDGRVILHLLNRTNKYAFTKLFKIHKICTGYDIVHTHMRHVHRYVRLAQFIFGGRYKLLLHDHYGIDQNIPASLKYIFKPQFYIGVSGSLACWAKSKLGIRPDHVYVLPNTILPQAANRYTGNENAGKAIMVANISRVKNIGFAIELAIKAGWELDIYGKSRDDAYTAHLKKQIESNPKIRIIDSITDFSRLYNKYELAVHSATSESGPLVLLEYLAAGIPFIAYKTGEVAETVYNDLPSLFMDSFDMDKWLHRAAQIRHEKKLPERMREVFDKYFSAENYTNECLRIYERISC